MAAPVMVPMMMARKVPSSMTPLPQERRLAGSSSGSRPYFDGPKSAACVATSPSATSVSGCRCSGEAGGGDGHGADLHDLGPDGDLALAEVVGEPAAGHAEEHEGHGEEEGDDGDEGVALVLAQAHADDHGEQKVAQDVIAVGALELGRDQRPEAALAALYFRCDGNLGNLGICRSAWLISVG